MSQLRTEMGKHFGFEAMWDRGERCEKGGAHCSVPFGLGLCFVYLLSVPQWDSGGVKVVPIQVELNLSFRNCQCC